MNKPPIALFSEQIKFKYPNQTSLSDWLVGCISLEGPVFESINIIFCGDEFLNEINQQYLNHKEYTDIITFNLAEKGQKIEAELFISIERVKENAASLKIYFLDELDRVIIHGLLHLMGYRDKTMEEIKIMRDKEDAFLLLRSK